MAHHGAKIVEPDPDAEFLTQGQAAALTGLPLTMIEWWCWSKKVQTRSRDLGPSVSRASLLAYIEERDARRHRPRPASPPGQPRPPVEPPSPEFIGVFEAAEILERKPESVGRIVKQAGLTIERSEGRMWLKRDEVEALAAERSSWISWADAAEMTGFSQSVIGQAVKAGLIEQRPGANRSQPGLSSGSLMAWAIKERVRRAEATARREAQRQRNEPPRDRHQWMRIGSAALVLGLSRSRVSQLVKEGRLPATEKDGKIWLRLDHVERARLAREAREAFSDERAL